MNPTRRDDYDQPGPFIGESLTGVGRDQLLLHRCWRAIVSLPAVTARLDLGVNRFRAEGVEAVLARPCTQARQGEFRPLHIS